MVLLNIMFHAPVERFQLELINYFTYFSTVVPSNICVFFPVGLSLLIQYFQQVLWMLKFLLSEETTKGLQQRNTHILDGTTVEK